MRDYSLAKLAYETYCESIKNTSFTSFTGSPFPKWDNVIEWIQDAWWEATKAVEDKVFNDIKIQRGKS